MENNKRLSNFELLRIICMLMIVTLHTLGNGGALTNTNINSFNFFLQNVLESISIVAVNCYVLISGYFGVNSEYKLKKIISLYIQVIFYSIGISLIFWGVGLENITLDSILRTFLPISMQTWWFISVYLVLYTLTPYINKLVKHLSFKDFTKLIVILFIVLTLWPSFFVKLKPIDIESGYSLYNFIYLYLIGAYINIFFKNKKLNSYVLMCIYLSSSLLLATFNVCVSKLVGHNWGHYSYNFILIFISSLTLFLFFRELKIKNNLINKLSGLTFGVYIIHEHPYIRKRIYNIFNYKEHFNNNDFILYAILVICTIYTLSMLIEYIRQCLFTHIPKCNINFYDKIKNVIVNKLNIIASNNINIEEQYD